MKLFYRVLPLLALLLCALSAPSAVSANHSWGGYHWARVSNPFTLRIETNLNTGWKPYLTSTISDWSLSNIFDMKMVNNQNNTGCNPINGRDVVCNKKFGQNGWLGIAQVWVSDGIHIYQGTTQLNDTYFTQAPYNSAGWKNLVMCQEVGHTLGLAHQDEDFYNTPLGTCMDYSADTSPNQHPNTHDYEELETIYNHLDTFTSLKATTTTNSLSLLSPREWGVELRRRGNVAEYRKGLENGDFVDTLVILAD